MSFLIFVTVPVACSNVSNTWTEQVQLAGQRFNAFVFDVVVVETAQSVHVVDVADAVDIVGVVGVVEEQWRS